MKNFKRILAFALALLFAASVFTGCKKTIKQAIKNYDEGSEQGRALGELYGAFYFHSGNLSEVLGHFPRSCVEAYLKEQGSSVSGFEGIIKELEQNPNRSSSSSLGKDGYMNKAGDLTEADLAALKERYGITAESGELFNVIVTVKDQDGRRKESKQVGVIVIDGEYYLHPNLFPEFFRRVSNFGKQ